MEKPPPPDPARKQIMTMNEATMPGDIGFMATLGTCEGEHIWNRMAMMIRKHSLDVRLLMDAHDRRNRGFVDVQTFRRSLCYAFGNQWIELGMSTAEFNEICEPYRSRLPHAKGEPDAFIMWQKFASDLQTLANTRRPSQNFLAKLEEVERKERVDLELQAKWGMDVFTLTSALSAIKDRLLTYNTSINKAFQRIDLDNSGSVNVEEMLHCFKDAHIEHIVNANTLDLIMSYCDATGDGEIDYNELASLIMTGDILERGIPEHRVIKVEARVGRNQIPVSVLRKAQKLIVEKLLTKFDTVREALRFIDTDGSGTIDREEIKEMLKRFNILEYTDFYTGMKRGDISEEVLDTFVEVCQGISLSSGDGDTRVETDEFTKVMMEEDIMNLDWQGAADYVEPRVGSRQVLISDLRQAQKLICLRLTTKFDTVREALRFIDTDGSGVIDREEIKEMLFRFNILAPRGEPAYAANGEYRVTEDVLDTFVEVCQGLSLNSGDGDTGVECDEFTEVIMAEDVMGLGDW